MDGRGSCGSIVLNQSVQFYAATQGFSVTNTKIFDSLHEIMPSCDSVAGTQAYNEIVILPKPSWPDRYYVFSYISFFSLSDGRRVRVVVG
jgi:hypothetical protein